MGLILSDSCISCNGHRSDSPGSSGGRTGLLYGFHVVELYVIKAYRGVSKGIFDMAATSKGRELFLNQASY
jgi:hypothetical protein